MIWGDLGSETVDVQDVKLNKAYEDEFWDFKYCQDKSQPLGLRKIVKITRKVRLLQISLVSLRK